MNLDNKIAAGNTANIYLRDGKIVKLFNDFLPDTEAEYEADKQRYARAQGFPVPEIFEVCKINGKQAILMEYVPGETIGGILSGDASKTERYMSLSVDTQ